ncbi:glycosyltransferase family 2 protein [Polynucleobacter sp. es-EL-1]|uniref:glycosyltransferase family 2 protein n=1 Tax=Polynucleobacter sp. es-EL-1 TaxID=1855652 RepID=UPI001BFD7783|nr:glycosyltransferase family 2 protein [Polynucleobacter sp. es-EL-1]QWE10884.1 glycosyltransferase family 2 protein [Polynucleobacter sp. es-EL-1]
MKKILCIGIPTFNRAHYLKRALSSIEKQLNSTCSIVVNVFDNNSTDNTQEVVMEFVNKYRNIFNYYKNPENIGPDLNVAQAYLKSSAKYTLVFGDDDVFLDGSIQLIIDKLSRDENYGLIFLNFYGFKNSYTKKKPIIQYFAKKQYHEIRDSSALLRLIGINAGFCSACIVNSEAINEKDLMENIGSYFNHLYPIIKSSQLGLNNLYFTRYMIAQQEGNSGNYDYFKVFADRFYKIYIELVKFDPISKRFIENEIIIKVLPSAIIFARTKKYIGYNINSINCVGDNFGHRHIYWIFIYPLIVLPEIVAKYLRILILIVSILYFNLEKYMILRCIKKV